ncbi:DUF4097 family beta strand repeat-containing protein [Actinocrispum wychmicini]|uniref:DUF4097 and DUF4098 domain-containing protein YvlB n=1 Tax=Actinocrispum wychmicini TaxID=1213861 RepID=A0A4R2IJY9_9PSEU|nr:DUF4097 family beta strand repeat-containing protein [Actinocrispum wychmicini]TCO45253.1 DUF4097 and DUF4098 domain-containing protein YvlB [Actinocrispum wychmicini]
MPTFDTPEPISVTLDVGVAGVVRFTASSRTDTVVEVRPSDENDESDVKAAQQIRVEYVNGELQIKGPKARFDFSRKTRSVDVSVELPSGSRVSADAQVGNLHGVGRLGETRFKTSAGNCQLADTGPLRVDTAAGHVTADHVAGNADIHTGSGKVSIGRIEGIAVVKDSNGNIEIDAVTGDARLRAANGDIAVHRAGAGVDAKTANGGIRLGEVVRGAVTLETAMGDLEIGIAEGTAAWLDTHTRFGQVRNQLDNTTQPSASETTVEVRARTSFGQIDIRRA